MRGRPGGDNGRRGRPSLPPAPLGFSRLCPPLSCCLCSALGGRLAAGEVLLLGAECVTSDSPAPLRGRRSAVGATALVPHERLPFSRDPAAAGGACRAARVRGSPGSSPLIFPLPPKAGCSPPTGGLWGEVCAQRSPRVCPAPSCAPAGTRTPGGGCSSPWLALRVQLTAQLPRQVPGL